MCLVKSRSRALKGHLELVDPSDDEQLLPTAPADMAFFARPQSANAAIKIVAPTNIAEAHSRLASKKGMFPLLSVHTMGPDPTSAKTTPNVSVEIYSYMGAYPPIIRESCAATARQIL